MARAITEEEKAAAQALLQRARAAMAAISDYDQAAVDRLCQAIAWATANEQTFGRLTRMSVEESGNGVRADDAMSYKGSMTTPPSNIVRYAE